MSKSFDLKPRRVAEVNTKYRRIATEIPVPESLPVLEMLREYEPRSMTGQPPIVWDRAEGFQVYDKYGNRWLDWSSGVLVANAGHSDPKVKAAIMRQVEHGLLHNYCFPSELRAELAKRLVEITPESLDKAMLLTTGSETTECAIKLMRTYGQRAHGKKKIAIVTFKGAFHGRTLGAQQAGGSPALKEWIVNHDPDIVQAPFPDCYRCPWGKEGYEGCHGECFRNFCRYLDEKGFASERISGIMVESYQGGSANFLPLGFAKKLSEYCRENDIILTFDEVQACFGRTGRLFAFEHYSVIPDLLCCGKGISSSLPLSAVIGRREVMDLYGPNEMTSTHTGNPVCVAAALANIECIIGDGLVQNAADMGEVMEEELRGIMREFPDVAGWLAGKGLVWGLHVVKEGSREPDGDLAHDIVMRAVEKGLMLFAPVGLGGATIKISPPLMITEDAVREGAAVLREAFREACSR